MFQRFQLPEGYEALVKRIEKLWKDSGANDECLKCIHGQQPGFRYNGEGCCGKQMFQGRLEADGSSCANLGPEGCLQKPFGCAIWICHDLERKMPEFAVKLNAIQAYIRKRFAYIMWQFDTFRWHAFPEFMTEHYAKARQQLIQIQRAPIERAYLPVRYNTQYGPVYGPVRVRPQRRKEASPAGDCNTRSSSI